MDVPAVRNRVVFDLRQRHEADLAAVVPLSHGLSCPVFSAEHWYSFSEIFLQGEYDSVLERIPPPARWLDLGCHAGYFSLHLAWQLRRRGLGSRVEALLVDADGRMKEPVKRMLAANQLNAAMRFAHGAIAQGAGETSFAQRSHMSSSLLSAESVGAQTAARVPLLDEESLMRLLPPPYDLVKIDIEGGEADFLSAYPSILSATRSLLMEWHSWHSGGGGAERLRELARERGFDAQVEISPARSVESPAGGSCGVWLLSRSSAPA